MKNTYNPQRIDEGSHELTVEYNELQCYVYNVTNEVTDLVIFLHSYSGNPDLYVHPSPAPDSTEDFAFSSTGDLDDKLTVSPSDRFKAGAKTGDYSICVLGVHASSF